MESALSVDWINAAVNIMAKFAPLQRYTWTIKYTGQNGNSCAQILTTLIKLFLIIF